MNAVDIKAGRTYISAEHGSRYRVDAIEGPLPIVVYTIISGPGMPQARCPLDDFAKRVVGVYKPASAILPKR